MDSAANPLPGVPIVESPFCKEILHSRELDEETLTIARDLHTKGYAIIGFPDPEFDKVEEVIRRNLYSRYEWEQYFKHQSGGLRVQDAWTFDENVKRLATNQKIITLLSALYGRPAFPFQTLNFPVGTEQHYHTDSLHFSSIPERFMCGVWVAFEDVDENSGPLIYYPGSHRWPIYTNEHIGGELSDVSTTQDKFHRLWEQLVRTHGIEPERFMPKKGQAIIWTANLLHGGDKQVDKKRTRWSQVTHYFFENCAYYTPMWSDPFCGKIHFREIRNVCTGERVAHRYNNVPISEQFIQLASGRQPPSWYRRIAGRLRWALGLDRARVKGLCL
jgi:hypothetical protein